MRRFVVLLFAAFLMVPVAGSLADDHHKGGKHFQGSQGDVSRHSGSRGGGDHGNETTGQLAIWLLVAANLTVVASVSIKAAKRLVPMREETKKWLTKINQTQKKYLMRFHYLLNPVVLAIAFLHWSLSRCRATSLPEWGLVCLAILAGLGLVLKLSLVPRSFTRTLYRFHTHPAVLSSILLILLTGHLIVD
ncbi:MAG: hypothetical protein ABFD97_01275 [Syntrophobacter sp.]